MRKAILLAALAATLRAETGAFTIHMILHAIGEEHYEINQESGGLTLTTSSEYSDRGMKRTAAASLRMTADYTPLGFESGNGKKVAAAGGKAEIQEDPNTRTADLPGRYFTILGPSPFAIQLAMMRYWLAHGQAGATADAAREGGRAAAGDRRGGPRFHHRGWQGRGAGALHHRESDVRARDSVDERAAATRGGDDVRGRFADGSGAQLSMSRRSTELLSRRRRAGDGGPGRARQAGCAGTRGGVRHCGRDADRCNGRARRWRILW